MGQQEMYGAIDLDDLFEEATEGDKEKNWEKGIDVQKLNF